MSRTLIAGLKVLPTRNAIRKQAAFDAATIILFTWLAAALVIAPSPALAQPLDLPFITTIGCAVIKLLQGPMAVAIWLLVTLGVLIVGLIAKLELEKIVATSVIFAIIIGLKQFLQSFNIVDFGSLMGCLK